MHQCQDQVEGVLRGIKRSKKSDIGHQSLEMGYGSWVMASNFQLVVASNFQLVVASYF